MKKALTKILIRNALLVATMDDRGTRIPSGDVLIDSCEIKDAGTGLMKKHRLNSSNTKIIDATGCIVLPGFVNTHHHLYQSLNRVLPAVQDAELFDWIKYLYGVWEKITPEWVHVSTQVGLAELLLTGCTTTTDQFYVFPEGQPSDLLDYEISAAREIGIRFHPSRGSMSCGKSKGGLPPDSVVQTEDKILRDCERVVNKYHDPGKFSMCRIVLAPCSPFSVTTELLKQTLEFARRDPAKKIYCHTHLAETLDEEKYCIGIYGKRPAEYIRDIGWLGGDVFFAHCVHLNTDEIKMLGRTKTGVAHCPVSNLRLSSGIAPIRELIDAGAKVGLAVDGSASNDSGNMLAELRQCLLVHRYRSGVTSMKAEEVVRLATRGGADVLGRDDIGSIEPGKAADVVLYDLNKIGYAGAMSDPLAALIFCGDTQIAKTVVVNGKVVVDDGRLVTVDEEKVTRKANLLTKMLNE
ncbi:MAG: 8-oxoguanine deaminase [Elusimicrobiota bacterium]